ncbi:MAG: oligosaccharide flippase family protein [Acidimicrobiia bacterium]|nr:oligosaccharide flippase family protein [Acidimicrobiia bacterium]
MTIGRLLRSELTRPAATVLVTRLVAAAAAFGLTLTVARLLGPEESGFYYLAMSVTVIASILGILGLDSASMRFVSTGVDTGDWGRVAGVYRQAVSVAGLWSVTLGVAIWALAPVLADAAFSNTDLEPVIRVAAWLVPLMTLMQIHAFALKGVQRPVAATIIQSLGPPTVAGLTMLASGVATAESALAVVVGTWAGLLVVAAMLWFIRVGPAGRQFGAFDVRRLLRTGLPLLVVNSMILIGQWTDTIMLGVFGDAADVGVYYPAWRVATIVSLVLFGINAVAPPRFAALHERGDIRGLEQLARQTSGLATAVALPALVVVVVIAPWILDLFGPDFDRAAGALRILAVGEFVNAAVGSVGFLIVMTGHERSMRNIMIATGIGNIMLNAALIPPLGINGAALATTISLVLSNLGLALWARRRLAVQPVAFLPPAQ